ncbi:hypothetical protein RFI_19119, partial [Reticulomyxa filosa]
NALLDLFIPLDELQLDLEWNDDIYVPPIQLVYSQSCGLVMLHNLAKKVNLLPSLNYLQWFESDVDDKSNGTHDVWLTLPPITGDTGGLPGIFVCNDNNNNSNSNGHQTFTADTYPMLVVCGGLREDRNQRIQCYNFGTRKWQQLADMKYHKANPCVRQWTQGAREGRVLSIGGYHGTDYSIMTCVEEFDWSKNKWYELPELSQDFVQFQVESPAEYVRPCAFIGSMNELKGNLVVVNDKKSCHKELVLELCDPRANSWQQLRYPMSAHPGSAGASNNNNSQTFQYSACFI